MEETKDLIVRSNHAWGGQQNAIPVPQGVGTIITGGIALAGAVQIQLASFQGGNSFIAGTLTQLSSVAPALISTISTYYFNTPITQHPALDSTQQIVTAATPNTLTVLSATILIYSPLTGQTWQSVTDLLGGLPNVNSIFLNVLLNALNNGYYEGIYNVLGTGAWNVILATIKITLQYQQRSRS
jgi:hypothetical protein